MQGDHRRERVVGDGHRMADRQPATSALIDPAGESTDLRPDEPGTGPAKHEARRGPGLVSVSGSVPQFADGYRPRRP